MTIQSVFITTVPTLFIYNYWFYNNFSEKMTGDYDPHWGPKAIYGMVCRYSQKKEICINVHQETKENSVPTFLSGLDFSPRMAFVFFLFCWGKGRGTCGSAADLPMISYQLRPLKWTLGHNLEINFPFCKTWCLCSNQDLLLF